MDTISQTVLSDTFSGMKSFIFILKFHWSLFLNSNWQYLSIGLDNGLALNRLTWFSDFSALGGDELTHWGRVTHICISKLTTIGSDNGLLPGRCQAIIWTNAGILLIRPLGTNFNEMLIEIHAFSFKKMHLKMLSVKWRLFCLGLNVLIISFRIQIFALVFIHGLTPWGWLKYICVGKLDHHWFR